MAIHDISWWLRQWTAARPYIHATLVTALAVLVAPLLQRLPHANLSLLFMTGVLVVAARYGIWPGIYASILSFLVFNFFFIAPHYTFSVSEEGDLATLTFFLLMASVSGNLAARMRSAISNREEAIRRTTALQDLAHRMAGAATREQILKVLVDSFAEFFGQPAVAVVNAGKPPVPVLYSARMTGPAEPFAGSDDLVAEVRSDRWTQWKIGSELLDEAFLSVRAAGMPPEGFDHCAAMISQATVALERVSLVRRLEEANLVSERERLRAALLSSVSHDLRTPLSSIIGAASSLATYGDTLPQDDKKALLASVLEESERLDRYIQNLLDMTRLEQGRLELQLEWEDILDLVSAASRRLRLQERGIHLDTNVAADAQFIRVHGDLIEQVLVNILDNAARYSPPGATIGIRTLLHAQTVVIEITDSGPGIPEAELERVFDPFYRVTHQDRRSGTGLGLSICRGIVRAHGGEVQAGSRPEGRGAVLRICLPLLIPQPAAT